MIPAVVLIGTLLLIPRTDAGAGNEAWNLTYTEPGWATTLTGIIIKPIGAGPFPGVVLSHGKGNNAEDFGLEKAVAWFAPAGYISIAVKYTHAGSVACNNQSNQCGGSVENVLRGRRALEILRSQNLIDWIGDVVNRDSMMLYGNSMGAFVSLELAEVLGTDVRAVAMTAGGIYKNGPLMYTTPHGTAGVNQVFVPVLHMHGNLDTVVPPSAETNMSNAFDLYGKVHELVWFPTGDHNIARDPQTTNQVRDLILAWFTTYG